MEDSLYLVHSWILCHIYSYKMTMKNAFFVENWPETSKELISNSMHCTKNWSFPLKISLVKMTKIVGFVTFTEEIQTGKVDGRWSWWLTIFCIFLACNLLSLSFRDMLFNTQNYQHNQIFTWDNVTKCSALFIHQWHY